ncbi:MAG: CBS domain-containing protein [Methanobacteriaceae archaeon]
MLASVQKEILQTLINLYQTSNGSSIKGEDIAEVMNRNPGTIRNQMQALRSLSLVKGVPGPRGGYKPTIEAYHTLSISVTDNASKVPIFKKGIELKDISVAKIEFTSIPHPGECEAAIKILGSIKSLDIGDDIRIGPTPVNRLGVTGTIVGRDDIDNILLLDTTTIRSIPKKTVLEVASLDLISIDSKFRIQEASKVMIDAKIEGTPVMEDNQVVGILTLTDIVSAIANSKKDVIVKDIMSKNPITVKGDLMIAEAIDLMHKYKVGRLIILDDSKNPIGIITRTDIVNTITDLKT